MIRNMFYIREETHYYVIFITLHNNTGVTGLLSFLRNDILLRLCTMINYAWTSYSEISNYRNRTIIGFFKILMREVPLKQHTTSETQGEGGSSLTLRLRLRKPLRIGASLWLTRGKIFCLGLSFQTLSGFPQMGILLWNLQNHWDDLGLSPPLLGLALALPGVAEGRKQNGHLCSQELSLPLSL